MAARSKAAKTGALAYALKQSPYVQRLLQDPELRRNLAEGFHASRSAYTRLSDGRAPHRAVFEDKRVKRDLRKATYSLRDAGEALREGPRRKKRLGLGRLIMLSIIATAVALGVSESLRKKALDALFGAEEEFEYTSPTTATTTPVTTIPSTPEVNGGPSGTADTTTAI